MAFQTNGNNAGVTEFVDDGAGDKGTPAEQAAIDRGDIIDGEDLALDDEPAESEVKDKPEPAAEEDDSKGKAIPMSRFVEVNERMKTAEARVAELEAKGSTQETIKPVAEAAPDTVVVPEFDFKAKRKASKEAMMDGDTELSAAIDDEIDAAREAQMMAKAKVIAADAVSKIKTDEVATALHQAAQEAANKAVEAYPFLSDNKEAYDEVVALRDSYTKTGMSLAEAITKAADRVAIIYGIQPAEAQAAPGTSRTEAARSRNADAANRQPPPTLKMGAGNRAQADKTLNPLVMSSDEIAALPQAERKRLRGDIL